MTTPQKPTNQVTAAGPVVDSEHPWLGLVAYSEKTQAYFFGRDAEIREMFTRVRDNPLTILFGQSGLGKTSLLGAGLVPKLKVEQYRPVLIRLDFSPGSPTLSEQARAALRQVLGIDKAATGWGLWEVLHHVPTRPDDLREHPPVLIFDQFEEIFTQAGTRAAEVREWFTRLPTSWKTARPQPCKNASGPPAS